MDFTFGIDDDPRVAVRRVARELIDFCADQLTVLDSPDLNIHEVRKACKKIRALLRLIRQAIDEPTYERENVIFRDLARPLGQCRDSLVRIDTFESLGMTNPNLRATLVADHQRHQSQFLADSQLHRDLIVQLKQAATRVRQWPLELNEYRDLTSGCLRVHEQGRKRMLEAQRNPSSEALHRCRKAVKYLWYQSLLLAPTKVWPLTATPDELDLLADALGREHDLADLACRVAELVEDEPGWQPAMGLIESKKLQLRADISRLSVPVFSNLES